MYLHSHGSSGNEGVVLLETCLKLNCSLLLVDARGCGNSGPGPTTFGIKEKLDVLFALFFVLVTEEAGDFILFGRSIGCCAILSLCSLLTPAAAEVKDTRTNFGEDRDIKKLLEDQFNTFSKKNPKIVMLTPKMEMNILGIILDAPFKSLPNVMESYVKTNFSGFGFLAKYAVGFAEKQIYAIIKQTLKNQQNIDQIARVSVPTVILHSKNDELITASDFRDLCNAKGTKLAFKGNLVELSHDHNHKAQRDCDLHQQAVNICLQAGSVNLYKYQLTNNEAEKLREVQNIEPKVPSLNTKAFQLEQLNTLPSAKKQKRNPLNFDMNTGQGLFSS